MTFWLKTAFSLQNTTLYDDIPYTIISSRVARSKSRIQIHESKIMDTGPGSFDLVNNNFIL